MKSNSSSSGNLVSARWPFLVAPLLALPLAGCQLQAPQDAAPSVPLTDNAITTGSLTAHISHTLSLPQQDLVEAYQALNAMPENARSPRQNILLAVLLSHPALPERNVELALALLSAAEQQAATEPRYEKELATLLYQLIQSQQALEANLAKTKAELTAERTRRNTLENQLRALKEVETGIIRRESTTETLNDSGTP